MDQLTLALRQWRETRDHVQPMEGRLQELTDRCAEIIDRWNLASERHARAVGEVESKLQHWHTIEHRLEEDSAQRMRELAQIIRGEWDDLRRLHEEPIKQLRDQAAALGETCMAAASLAVRGFERTEARLGALESDLHSRLNQLSRDIQTLAPRPSPPAAMAPFPLDEVMRIHGELRGDAKTPALAPPADTAPAVVADPQRLLARVDSLERELTTEREEVRRSTTATDRLARNWRAALVFAAALLLITGYFGFRLLGYVEARMNDANTRVAAAERQAQVIAANASREVAATRTDAERQIGEARRAALQAQLASAVSVAPDLVRFQLTSTDATAPATAQVLWSRTTGLVFTATRLPALPDGTTYQIWLLSNTSPIAAGLCAPDRNGRVTIAFDNPAELPRPINGVMVTLEPAGGASSPSSTPVLIRAPQ